MAVAATIKDPTARQGRISGINDHYAPLLVQDAHLDSVKAAADAAKRREAEDKRELEAMLKTEESQRRAIRNAQTRNAELDAELATGGKLTESQKKLVDLESLRQPLTKMTLEDLLRMAAAKERELSAQEKEIRLAEREAQRLRDPKNVAKDLIGAIGGNPFNIGKDSDAARAAEEKRHQESLKLLQKSLKDKTSTQAEYDAETEAAEQEHQNKLDAIDKKQASAQQSLQDKLFGIAKDGLGAAASLQDKSTKEGFERYKKFSEAQAVVSTIQGAINAFNSAMYLPWPYNLAVGAASAAVVVASGYAQIAQINSQQYTGRALGGPVDAGGMYQVGEGGRPELLQSDGKYYLLPGDNSGVVTPAKSGAAENDSRIVMNVNVEVVGTNGPTSASAQQDGHDMLLRLAVNSAQLALQKDIANGGPTSKALQQTYSLQRKGY